MSFLQSHAHGIQDAGSITCQRCKRRFMQRQNMLHFYYHWPYINQDREKKLCITTFHSITWLPSQLPLSVHNSRYTWMLISKTVRKFPFVWGKFVEVGRVRSYSDITPVTTAAAGIPNNQETRMERRAIIQCFLTTCDSRTSRTAAGSPMTPCTVRRQQST
jgi:hypothetical protein